MNIRPARPEEKREILTLVTTIFDKEFPSDSAAYATDDLEQLPSTYRAPENLFLVAESGGRIVGTCGVKGEDSKTALLRRLFVDSDFRRQGIGRRLLDEALQFCRQRGLREILIRTSTRMVQAIRLCESLGFQEEGRWGFEGATLVRLRLRLR